MSSWQLQPHPSPHSYLHDRQPIVILFFTLNLISISPSSIPITFPPQSTSSTLVRILLPSISSLLWPPILFRRIESHFDRHPPSFSSSCPFPFLPSPSPSVHILVPFSNLNFIIITITTDFPLFQILILLNIDTIKYNITSLFGEVLQFLGNNESHLRTIKLSKRFRIINILICKTENKQVLR